MTDTLSMETDYENEARQLNRARELFGSDQDFAVPRAYKGLSTKRVLVMDYLPGVHLDRFLASQPTQAEANSRSTVRASLVTLGASGVSLVLLEAMHR